MIYSISGEVVDVGVDYVVVDTNGVGYLIYVTSSTLGQMHIGQNAVLFTILVVREDSMTLYGFVDKANRNVFNILLSVSGVGPKLALACLNTYNANTLASAIKSNDLKTLEKIPGVGKRSAQRMVLEVGDKLSGYASSSEDKVLKKHIDNNLVEQVTQALEQLGFNSVIAENAIEQVLLEKDCKDTSVLLKECLMFLGEKRG